MILLRINRLSDINIRVFTNFTGNVEFRSILTIIINGQIIAQNLSRRIIMINKILTNTPVCKNCNKPLEKTTCFACGGKGFKKELLIFKSNCQNCNGRGWILRCPDEISHITANLKTVNKKAFDPTKMPPPDYFRKMNPLDRSNPQSPFNPNNPNSHWNINNPQNPNSLRNPNNPSSPLYRNPFKK